MIVAVILSSVRCLFIALNYFAVTSALSCCFSWMTLSQRSTQMRCIASYMDIWRRRDAPFCRSGVHSLRFLVLWGLICAVMLLHLSMFPSVISGQLASVWGQSFFASPQISATGISLQVSRMWLISSRVPH